MWTMLDLGWRMPKMCHVWPSLDVSNAMLSPIFMVISCSTQTCLSPGHAQLAWHAEVALVRPGITLYILK